MKNRLLAPKIINIELTTYCPYMCPQCYKRSQNNLDIAIDILELKKIIKEAAEIGVKKILFSGGEPMSYPWIYEAIEEVKKRGMQLYISTGGYGVDKNEINKLRKIGVDVLYISLNGSTEEINSKSREGFEHALNAMKLAAHVGINTKINWVAREDNLDDFKNLIKLAKSVGTKGIDILKNKPDALGFVQKKLSYEGLVTLSEIINRYRGDIEINIESCYFELRNICEIKIKHPLLKGCSGGRYSIAINAHKIMLPCAHIGEEYGENSDSILNYWRYSNKLIDFLKFDNKFDACLVCVHKEYCQPCIIAYGIDDCAICKK